MGKVRLVHTRRRGQARRTLIDSMLWCLTEYLKPVCMFLKMTGRSYPFDISYFVRSGGKPVRDFHNVLPWLLSISLPYLSVYGNSRVGVVKAVLTIIVIVITFAIIFI